MRRLFHLIIILSVLSLLSVSLGVTYAQSVVTVTAQVQASIRQGPGRQFPALSSIPEGGTAPALARSQDNAWVQVTFNTVTGWVALRQLTVTGNLNALPVSATPGSTAPTGPAAPPPAAATTGVTLTAQTQANIRQGPGLQFAILGSIPEGASVTALARSEDSVWAMVSYNGITGWTATRLFTVTGNLNALAVSDAVGGAGPASPAAAVRPANTRTITVSQQTFNTWGGVSSEVANFVFVNGQLGFVGNFPVNGATVQLAFSFNVVVVNGQFVATLTAASRNGEVRQASQFNPQDVAKLNQSVSDALNQFFHEWVGNYTPISVVINPGEMVITYAV